MMDDYYTQRTKINRSSQICLSESREQYTTNLKDRNGRNFSLKLCLVGKMLNQLAKDKVTVKGLTVY